MIQGELLKKYREQNNLTIKDLSKLMHISKKIISLWEDGSKIPFDEDIAFLCSLYNIEREDLTYEKVKEQEPEIELDIKNKNIVYSILIIIISCILGAILKNRLVGIVLSISLTIIYNAVYYIIDECRASKIKNGPKSIFGISLLQKEKKDLVKYYTFESLIIASIYLLLSLITFILKIKPLIVRVTILEDEMFNMLFIWGSLFIVLSGLILIIEIIFGSILIKRER